MSTALREALAAGQSVKVPTLASALGVSRNGFYEAVKRGEVKVTRLGRRIIIPAQEARRLLQIEEAA